MIKFDNITSFFTNTLGKGMDQFPEPRAGKSDTPKAIITKASAKAASISAVINTTPLGLALIVPELRKVHDNNMQMLSDLAYVHGKEDIIGREFASLCIGKQLLFKYLSGYITHKGSTLIIRKIGEQGFEKIATQILKAFGVKLAARKAGGQLTLLAAPAICGSLTFADTYWKGMRAMKHLNNGIHQNSDEELVVPNQDKKLILPYDQ